MWSALVRPGARLSVGRCPFNVRWSYGVVASSSLSTGVGGGGDGYPEEFKKSPWYKKSRLDWLFGEGYRRPLATDQGGTIRKEWLSYGFHPTDEYTDWKYAHIAFATLMGLLVPGFAFFLIYKPDWPQMREWAFREACLELERREKSGLPPISKNLIDPEKVKLVLPSDEELGDFDIVI